MLNHWADEETYTLLDLSLHGNFLLPPFFSFINEPYAQWRTKLYEILYSTALAEITLKLGKTAFLSIYDKTAHITHSLID